jgi:hypothetical protein
MKLFSQTFLFVSLVYAIGVIGYIAANQPMIAKAATDNSNVVISQVQTGGVTASDEFVELYNPTNTNIDITGWSLKRKTAMQTGIGTTLVASLSGTISPHTYFLIVSPQYTGSVHGDISYSSGSTIGATDNTVLIYNNDNTPIDKVGMGAALDFEGSGSAQNPIPGGSIERKPLTIGDNGSDTDNNTNDFILLATSMPRNSASPAAAVVPTMTPEPTETPIPTTTPELTETPTGIPTPTVSPTPSQMPSPTPTPIVVINHPIPHGFHIVCTETHHAIKIFGHQFHISVFHVRFVRQKQHR